MKEITIDNYHELQPWIEAAGYEDCNANIVTMLMWQFPYPFYFEVFEHYALACYQIRETGEFYWYMPFCTKEYRKEAVDAMLAYGKAHQIPPRLSSVTRECRDWLQKHYYGEILFHEEWDGKDYIYDRQQQESLAGKKMQKRRNHYHAFQKQYAGRYEFHRLSPADSDAIYAFLKEWQESHDEQFGIREEEQGIRFLLEHFDRLPLDGGVITIDGKLQAFSIVSHINAEMIDIHVEKANREIRGLYVAILKLFLETLDDQVRYIDREDDMGLAALAKAKHDMRPIRIAPRYTARFAKWQITRPTPQDQDALKALWLKSFSEETEQTARFYFERLYHPADCRIVKSEDTIIAMAMAPTWRLSIGQKSVPARFIEGVATKEGYRHCGYMQLLLQHFFQSDPNAIWMLQAYNWDVYRPFGFTETHWLRRTVVEKSAYPHAVGQWKQVDAATCLSLYQQFTQAFDGYRIRDLAYYEQFWLPYQACAQAQVRVHEQNGKADGYACWQETARQIIVEEVLYQSEEALHDMAALLCDTEKEVVFLTDLRVKLKGVSQKQPALMMKEPPMMQEPRYFSECV